MSKNYPGLMDLVINLLDTGHDTGCEGLVVVEKKEFIQLMNYVQQYTGILYGNIDEYDESL